MLIRTAIIIIVYVTGCYGLDLTITPPPSNYTTIADGTTLILDTNTTTAPTPTTTTAPITITTVGTNVLTENNGMPKDCLQRQKRKNQPIRNNKSRLKKCCPMGEGLNTLGDRDNDHQCDSTNLEFNPNIINAVLYDNCIEDNEEPVTLPYKIGNPCNMSIVYTNEEDMIYVLQDGSLLIMDQFANVSYAVETTYCLDIDNVSGVTYAIVCITAVEEHIKRGEILTVAILMLISVPCLLFVSYLHITIKDLRTLHGLSLSVMSLCLAVGYFLYSLIHVTGINSSFIGYAVQFFILSYFFWFFCLSCNVLINIWYKIPRNKPASKTLNYVNYSAYCVVSFTGPMILVLITIKKGFPGMPSYFLQGLTESIRESQRYFIPPISTLLFMSFIAMACSFFGFQKIKKEGNNQSKEEISETPYKEYDRAKYEEVKKDAKCISLLLIITILTWLLEIVTFYSPGPENYLILMEMINGLQGVLIMLIFVVVRRRRTIILRWWYDRGTHNIEDVELTAINKPNSN